MLHSDLLRRLGPLLLVLPLAGCAVPMTSSNTYLVPLANGESMEMSIKNGGLAMVESGGIRMVLAALNPSTDKKHVVYNFEMAVKSGLVPRRIQIEDQTEDPVHTIVDDAAPHLDGGRWKLTTAVLDPKDAGNEWITQLDDSIRVFRVTVTLADGTTVVLRQPALFPVYEKQLIRVMLGIDKIPK